WTTCGSRIASRRLESRPGQGVQPDRRLEIHPGSAVAAPRALIQYGRRQRCARHVGQSLCWTWAKLHFGVGEEWCRLFSGRIWRWRQPRRPSKLGELAREKLFWTSRITLP